ncbi:ABC transporter substrate-binding protein [Streptomyces chitinivorans]|uniref:ABC transporter substrate-binding protein n=1 Tax=Streptomyces chitinivorans TaxID=1257027 RepID=A0ABW7HPE1_9ACTN|nr:ABC transporter substrate-binding protein [Streptomyces chitinivorans]MDH2411804.1 ABC transporter substrate-binding protein [Streptomyces chitinivorans]
MTKLLRTTLATTLSVCLAAGLGACSTDDDPREGLAQHTPGAVGIVGGTPQRGGTLTVLADQDFPHLDPARNWVMPAMDFGIRLLYRTLVTFKAEPGRGGTEIVPDLATDLGRPSQGGRVWTFTLKKGLKYEDGSPIRAQDVKYNVERSFAPQLSGGPDYARRYLAGTEGYEGPLDGEHLDSIETPDDRTIVFRLNRPVSEFSQIATLPTFSPVPPAQEKGTRYDLRPFSSGPYKIEKYSKRERMVLIRNPHWDPATDPVRKAYPDKIVVRMGRNGAHIDDRLIASEGEDASSVQWSDTQPDSMPELLADTSKSALRKRLVAEITGCTDMLHLNTSKPPFDDSTVRKAVQYAINREDQVATRGGPALNEPATSYLPPTLTGGDRANPLDLSPTGNPGRARELLAEAGLKQGVNADFTVSREDTARAQAIQKDLSHIGINVRIQIVDPAVYFDTIGDTRKAPDMSLSGWCPDYPSGATFLPFLFDGRTIKEKGNQGNYSQFRDGETMERIDEISVMADATQANQAWRELDRQIMRKSPAIPLLWERRPLLVGNNIAGAFGHSVWSGQLDYAVIGLKHPEKSPDDRGSNAS